MGSAEQALRRVRVFGSNPGPQILVWAMQIYSTTARPFCINTIAKTGFGGDVYKSTVIDTPRSRRRAVIRMAGSCIVETTAAAKEEGKLDEPVLVTERVPQSFIRRIRTLPTQRPRPLTEAFILNKPELLQRCQTLNYNLNKLVDLEQNVLRQVDAKGYAEVVVKYTDDGIKKIYPLPGY